MAEKKFLVDLNLGGNKAKNFRFEDYADNTAPTSNFVGRLIYTTTGQDRLELYTDNGWKQLAFIDDTPPLDQDLIDIAALTGDGILSRQSGVWAMDTNTYLTSADLTGYVTFEGVETLSNKTFNNSINLNYHDLGGYDQLVGSLSFWQTGAGPGTGFGSIGLSPAMDNVNISINASSTGSSLSLSANQDVTISSNSADIILQPDGVAKVWNNEILTTDGSATITNKQYNGSFQWNPASGSQPNTGYAILQYKDTNDGIDAGTEGLYLTSNRGWVSPQSGGKMYISSFGDMSIESQTGNMQFFMDGGMYIGNVDSANQIIKRSDLSPYLTNDFNAEHDANQFVAGTIYEVGNSFGGYSFHNDGGLDTGLFSNGDGNIKLYSNSVEIVNIDSTGVTIDNDLYVTGNINVDGNLNAVNRTEVNIEDNTIVLNTGFTGTPVADAGITVERGDATDATLFWSELNDYWMAGVAGDSYKILLSGVATSSDISGFNNSVDTEIDAHLSGSDSISYSSGAIDTTLATTSYLTKTGGLAVDKSSLETALVTDGFIKKYATDLTGSATSYTVTHNLGTRDITVQVYETASPYGQIETAVEYTTTNTATVYFNTAPTSGAYRVVVTG